VGIVLRSRQGDGPEQAEQSSREAFHVRLHSFLHSVEESKRLPAATRVKMFNASNLQVLSSRFVR
jgi:hypothetical protein